MFIICGSIKDVLIRVSSKRQFWILHFLNVVRLEIESSVQDKYWLVLCQAVAFEVKAAMLNPQSRVSLIQDNDRL